MKIYREAWLDAKDKNQERPQASEYIGECILKIAQRLAYRPNFINYSFREEFISDAIENCFQYLGNFDPNKTNNPFAYFSSICWYAFIRRIQKEKKQSYIKCKIADIHGYLEDDASNETKAWKEKSDEIIESFEKTMNVKRSGRPRKGLESFMSQDNKDDLNNDADVETKRKEV